MATFRYPPRYGEREVLRAQAGHVRRIEASYDAALADSLVAAVAAAGTEAGKVLRELARVIESGVADAELTRAHRTIASLAQRSVLGSYDQTVTRRRHGPMRGYDYRRSAKNPRNRRFAGGKLRRALASPEFWSADQRGIRFINTSLLNAEAKHWARLSAGAGSRGHGSKRRFEVRWGNLTVAALGLDMTPSPAFMIPKGYWRDPGGGPVGPGARGTSAFFPLGEGPFPTGRATARVDKERWGGRRVPLQRRRLSRGIEGRNFLDAGVRRISREMGPTYQRMYDDLYLRRVATVRPAITTVRARNLRARVA